MNRRNMVLATALTALIPIGASGAPPTIAPVDVNVVNPTLQVIEVPTAVPRSRLLTQRNAGELATGTETRDYVLIRFNASGVLQRAYVGINVYGEPALYAGSRCIVALSLGTSASEKTLIGHYYVKQGSSEHLHVELPNVAVNSGDAIFLSAFNQANQNCHTNVTTYMLTPE